VIIAQGCGQSSDPAASAPVPAAGGYSDYYSAGEIQFLDTALSNAPLDAGLTSISFITPEGQERKIEDLAQEKNLVVVVTRGNTTPICPYCSTQTARLITGYQDFVKRGAEIVVVYPVSTGSDSARLNEFLTDVRGRLTDARQPVPFPVLLDVELKGVDRLGIRKDLSKPATYIVDRQGQVRYAYVGEHLADRPATAAILKELDGLAPAASTSETAPATGSGVPDASADTSSPPAQATVPAGSEVPGSP